MVKFFRKNEKTASVLKGLMVSFLLSVGMIFVLAFFLYKFSLPKTVIGVGVILIYIISTFAGGLILGKSMGRKKYLWGLALGTIYFLILMIVSLLVNGGFQNQPGNIILTLVLCAGSGMLGGMFG